MTVSLGFSQPTVPIVQEGTPAKIYRAVELRDFWVTPGSYFCTTLRALFPDSSFSQQPHLGAFELGWNRRSSSRWSPRLNAKGFVFVDA